MTSWKAIPPPDSAVNLLPEQKSESKMTQLLPARPGTEEPGVPSAGPGGQEREVMNCFGAH